MKSKVTEPERWIEIVIQCLYGQDEETMKLLNYLRVEPVKPLQLLDTEAARQAMARDYLFFLLGWARSLDPKD